MINGDGSPVLTSQPLIIQPFKSTFPYNTGLSIALVFFLLQLFGADPLYITCELWCLLAIGIDPKGFIIDHNARYLQQCSFKLCIVSSYGFYGDKGLIGHPSRRQSCLNIFNCYIEKLCELCHIRVPRLCVYFPRNQPYRGCYTGCCQKISVTVLNITPVCSIGVHTDLITIL